MSDSSGTMETEVKIRIDQEQLDRVRTLLKDLGGRSTYGRRAETNLLFDFPDGRLKQNGCALRLRTVGSETLLTFKGRVVEDPHFKKRPEMQTRVASASALRQILEAVGLRPVFQYDKYREVLELTTAPDAPVEICLDETPVGVFVEIEGAPSSIRRVARELGWQEEDFIRTNYIELYKAAGLGQPGEPAGPTLKDPVSGVAEPGS